jgi:hypothetical protein
VRHEPIIIHTFKGARFDGHGLDLDVFPEMAAYHKIVVETAKELWRRKNDRVRAKKNIEDAYSLKIFELKEGSVSAPICREYSQETLFPVYDELDEAVDLIAEAIAQVDAGKRLPGALPKSVISMFCNYGKTLRDDEFIEHKNPKTGFVANYTKAVREEFERRSAVDYTDEFDIVGSIIMTRVNKPKISVLLDDGNEVEAPFEDDNKSIIFKALQAHTELKVRLVGIGNFLSDGTLQRVTKLKQIQILGEQEGAAPIIGKRVPIWERLKSLADKMPPDVRELLSPDASNQVDQYLYGDNS